MVFINILQLHQKGFISWILHMTKAYSGLPGKHYNPLNCFNRYIFSLFFPRLFSWLFFQNIFKLHFFVMIFFIMIFLSIFFYPVIKSVLLSPEINLAHFLNFNYNFNYFSIRNVQIISENYYHYILSSYQYDVEKGWLKIGPKLS